MIVGMNHITIVAEDERQTLDFYVGLLGLTVGYRPALGFPGAWLYMPAARRLCCTCTSSARCRPRARGSSTTWPSVPPACRSSRPQGPEARFDAAGIVYDLRRQAGALTWQLFSTDPNGAKVELDFDPSETL